MDFTFCKLACLWKLDQSQKFSVILYCTRMKIKSKHTICNIKLSKISLLPTVVIIIKMLLIWMFSSYSCYLAHICCIVLILLYTEGTHSLAHFVGLISSFRLKDNLFIWSVSLHTVVAIKFFIFTYISTVHVSCMHSDMHGYVWLDLFIHEGMSSAMS